MFDQLFGRYLVATNCISQEQLDEMLKKQNKIRVKLGLIAVSEKYMTNEQADEVNRLQSMMDKRFGDIAIEKGYLTQDQVNKLLELQGNVYLTFIQSLLDSEYMTMQGIEAALAVFQKVNNYSMEEMEGLKAGDTNKIISLFTKDVEEERYLELVGILVRTCIRIIDNKMFIGNVYETKEYVTDCYAEQRLCGDFDMTLAFCGTEGGFVPIANEFAGEEYTEVDEDVLDACCEFINCINGMLATSLSQKDIDVDMDPPMYSPSEHKVYTGKKIYVLPIYIKGLAVDAVIIEK